jgi:hypothetical protein
MILLWNIILSTTLVSGKYYRFSIDDNTVIDMNVTYGDIIMKKLPSNIKCIEKICLYNVDQISLDLYDVQYTPSSKTSTYEDHIGRRWDVLTFLKKYYNYTSYLEIGCSKNDNFNKMQLLFNSTSRGNFIGVDPERGGTMRMTSDEFFEQNKLMFDLIFVDGLHEAHQVYCIYLYITNLIHTY